MKKYEVIVVGGGHGGVEASLAAARLGKKTAMFTLYLDTISMITGSLLSTFLAALTPAINP